MSCNQSLADDCGQWMDRNITSVGQMTKSGGVDRSNVNLLNDQLGDTILRGAILDDICLENAYLGNANLMGASLINANLQGEEVTLEQLKHAIKLDDLIMPDGTKWK